MKKERIRLALVDDHSLFRAGIKSLLTKHKCYELCFEANNGRELLDKMKTEKPDVVLLDMNMPSMNGEETLIELKKKHPKSKVIILSGSIENSRILSLIEKGANAVLNKNTSFNKVSEAIQSVFSKGFYFDEATSKMVALNTIEKGSVQKKHLTKTLSEREIEVIRLICQQKTNKEIASDLGLSPRTVDTYKENIFIKTGSKNIAGVALYAVENNIIGFGFGRTGI